MKKVIIIVGRKSLRAWANLDAGFSWKRGALGNDRGGGGNG